MKKCICVLSLLFIINASLFAGDNYHAGFLPSLTLRTTVIDNWQINATYSSRNSLMSGTFGEDNQIAYDLLLTDLSLMLSRRLKENHFLAAGYLFRIRKGDFHQRFIQQYTYRKGYNRVNTWHRVRTEQQTVFESEIWKYSLRYRFALELPLSNNIENEERFALRFEQEFLTYLHDGAFNLDYRNFLGLVTNFSSKHQLTAGPAWWLSRLKDDDKQHFFWLQLAWRTSI